MKTLKNKIEEIKKAVENSNIPRNQYKNRPIGCPMLAMMDSRLVDLCTGIDLYKAFAIGVIGNEGCSGTIINNSKNISEYLN